MADNNIESAQNPTEREQNLRLKQLLKNVIMTGIPQIAAEHNFIRQTFKIVMFFTCLIGFLIQLTEFLLIYFTYPTTMEILIEHKNINQLPKPTITICDVNSIRRKSFCHSFPNKCAKIEDKEDFCKRFNQICTSKNITEEDLMFPSNYFLEYVQYNRSFLDKFGVRLQDILPSHIKKNIFTRIIHSDAKLKVHNCYSIDLENFTPLDYYEEEIFHLYEDFHIFIPDSNSIGAIYMHFNPEDIFCPYYQIGAMISIHSKDSIDNPFINGFFVQPESVYMVRLKAEIKSLLPAPYSTNCTYYSKMANESLNKTLNRDHCLYECKRKLWIEKCGCVSTEYPFIINENFCDPTADFYCTNEINVTSCYNECQNECKHVVFEYNVEKFPTSILHNFEINNTHHHAKQERKPFAAINLFFKNPELVTHKFKPMFQSVELFGYIGGYIGMWLGISLIAVCDFLEVICVYLYQITRDRIHNLKAK